MNTFSKIGFVLSVAGGAIGLGNAWKFPTLVGENGGFFFVLLYLFFAIFVGLALFLAELAMGRLSGSDLANAYESLAVKNGKKWRFAGLSMLTGIFVLSFYLVVMAWALRYMWVSLFYLPSSLYEAKIDFQNLISTDLYSSFLFFIISFLLTIFIVSKGIIKGIERLNLILMPTLFIMLLFLLFYCFSFEKGFSQAFSYLFYPKLENLSFSSALNALGLALFTLCLGIGCIVTYSASLNSKTNFITSSLVVVFLNVLISLLMGLIVFTFIFEFDVKVDEQGSSLVFISLMSLFYNLGYLGNFLAFYFFLALFLAGISSAVSMIEPLTFYLINEYKFSRKKALFFLSFLVFALSCACILSINKDFSSFFSFFSYDFFTILDKFSSNILLPLGSLLVAIFVGFFVDVKKIYKLFSKFMSKKVFKIWLFCLRFVAVFAILITMIYQIFV